VGERLGTGVAPRHCLGWEARARCRAEEAGAPVSDQRLASIRQELAVASRALDRYFAAFQEGVLSLATRFAHRQVTVRETRG
jgi:hypothetical protein